MRADPDYPHRGGLIVSIEGVRALAVLAVLLFHLDVPGLQGGYLGVDLFFVISGYIITRNIVRQHDTGEFSLSAFYLARFRRLIPALAVVLLLTLVAAAFLMPPEDLEAAGQSALYTALSVSNWLFWWQSGYFDAASHSKPLLHTWSLGVEEQFYLVWPVMLLALLRWRKVVLGCAVLAVVSLAAVAWLQTDHPSAVFYLTPFRAYQFMAGAIIAVAGWSLAGRVGNIVHGLSLAGAGLVFWLMSDSTPPLAAGVAAAAVGLGLILTRDAPLATTLTGHPAMAWIGARSYAIYLVHWPLIVMLRYALGPELSGWELALAAAGSVAGASALHRLVELPFRRRDPDIGRAARAATPFTVVVLLAGMFLGGNLWGMRGFPGNQPDDIRQMVELARAAADERRILTRTGTCHVGTRFDPRAHAESGCVAVRPDRVNVLVVGDSVAADLHQMLSHAYPQVAFAQATGGRCPPLADVPSFSACEALNRYRFEELPSQGYDYVVFASSWRPTDAEPLGRTIAAVRRQGPKVIVVGPGIRFGEDVVRILSMSDSVEQARQRIRAQEKRTTELRRVIRAQVKNAVFIDLAAVQCPQRHCESIKDGRMLYVDKFHLSPAGTEEFARQMVRMEPDLFAPP